MRITLGRRPTLGEVLDYYSRDDFLRFLFALRQTRRVVMVISETPHWEPDWERDEVPAVDGRGLREFMLDKVAERFPGVGREDRPPHYPSFHQSVWKRSDGQPGQRRVRDCIFETDLATWRDSFQDVYPIVDLMERHEVPYQHKFSGHRSLHIVIPGEALPQGYRGKGASSLAGHLLRWGGSQAHHLPKITRMPYSLNEDTGLVCLPIERGALPRFRPWQANLHLVEVRDACQERITEEDRAQVEALVEWLKASRPGEPGPGDEMPRRAFFTADRERILSSNRAALHSLQAEGDLGKAWQLLTGERALAERDLLEGLDRAELDARWLTVEAFLLNGTDLSKTGLLRLLEQEEEYVRPAAVDVVLRFEEMVFADLVEMIGELDRYSTAGARAAYLLTQSDSLRNRVLQAIIRRTGRSHDALVAGACLAGAMAGDWQGAMGLVAPLRGSPDLTGAVRIKLQALDLMSAMGGWDKRKDAKRSQALADLGNEVTDLLLIAATSPHRRFRRGIVGALATLADERAVDLLVRSLGDEFSQVRRKAISGLTQIGEPAVDALIEATASDHTPVRRYALLCLGRIASPRAKLAILQALDDGEEVVRRQAIRALQHVGGPEDVARLKQVLRDESFENAAEAVTALEALGDAGRQAMEEMALAEGVPAAAYYLARNGDPRGREMLAARLAEGDPWQADAAEFLRELKDERCVPFFTDMVRTTTHWRGAFIARELGRIGTPEAVALLIEVLSRDASHVRRGAVLGLGEARDPAAIETLIRCLYDEDAKVRSHAADALVAIGQASVVPVRRALEGLGERDRRGRDRLQQVLAKLGAQA